MAQLDKIMRNVAKQLINAYGKKNLTIIKMISGVAQTPVHKITGSVGKFKESEINSNLPKTSSNTLIKRTDLKLLLSKLDIEALGITITSNDRIEIDNKNYKILTLPKTYSGDQIAMETLILRK
jgi:hypothetical protein